MNRTMKRLSLLISVLFVVLSFGCGSEPDEASEETQFYTALKEVPAVRLNYRYEADVPAPEIPVPAAHERHAAVQAHFELERLGDVLDRTITSPDGNRVIAIFHRPGDLQDEYRLDMYLADGTPMQRITPDAMAVHFQETIVWSPDSKNVAFVAMLRDMQPAIELPDAEPGTDATPEPTPTPLPDPGIGTDANIDQNIDPGNTNAEPPGEGPTDIIPPAPANVLTFRTEQIYICNADGLDIKPITQNEGLIYFYYVWSPDSSMLASLAVTLREWQFLKFRADEADAIFVPSGRPRIVETNGRERRLDDGLTSVHPVWSPDSAKAAVAFDKQVRIYDAGGVTPTQAAVPLQNALLLSSQEFDRAQDLRIAGVNAADANANTANPTPSGATTLPDPNTLVSYNPIISLFWQAEDLLYFQTAAVKRMKIEADSMMSFPRWHRLILTPQARAEEK